MIILMVAEGHGKVKQMPVDKAEGVSYYSPEHVMEVLDDDVAVNSYALTALGPGMDMSHSLPVMAKNLYLKEIPVFILLCRTYVAAK